jgi:hypothetical protein
MVTDQRRICKLFSFLGSGSDRPRSLTEFTLSVSVEGFGMTKPLLSFRAAGEESFLMSKVSSDSK